MHDELLSLNDELVSVNGSVSLNEPVSLNRLIRFWLVLSVAILW